MASGGLAQHVCARARRRRRRRRACGKLACRNAMCELRLKTQADMPVAAKLSTLLMICTGCCDTSRLAARLAV